LAFYVAPACGGAPATITGKAEGGGAYSTSSGGGGNGGGSTSSGGGGSNSGVIDANGMQDATTSYDAPVSDDAAVVDDSATDAVVLLADAGHGDISCPGTLSTATCNNSQICCVTSLLGVQSGSCTTNTTCTGTPIQCSGGSSCPGHRVCCGIESTLGFGSAMYTQVSCADTCTGTNHIEFCSMGDVCPPGTTCRTSTILSGYTVCR
jgi:hypothetical protein